MSGLLLLLLASFIVASISYIADMIPEVTLPTGIGYVSVYTRLIYNATGFVAAGGGWNKYFSPPVLLNHTSYQYILAVRSPTNASAITSICYNEACYQSLLYYNNSVAYLVVPSNVTQISHIGLRANTAGNYTIYFIEAGRNASANDALRAFFYRRESGNNTTTPIPQTPAPAISNRLILNFISWVAGIVLMLEALRRFDLEI
jgi:hypothetical protein